MWILFCCLIQQVCSYHQQFYRPENLCVIITGQIDPVKVFQTVKSFEDKILTKARSTAFLFTEIKNNMIIKIINIKY